MADAAPPVALDRARYVLPLLLCDATSAETAVSARTVRAFLEQWHDDELRLRPGELRRAAQLGLCASEKRSRLSQSWTVYWLTTKGLAEAASLRARWIKQIGQFDGR